MGIYPPVHQLAAAQNLQSPNGLVRAGGYYVEHLLRLVAGSLVPDRSRPGLCGEIPRDAKGLPAASEGGELQPRRGHEDDDGAHWPLTGINRHSFDCAAGRVSWSAALVSARRQGLMAT
jgi:hypothetical protein